MITIGNFDFKKHVKDMEDLKLLVPALLVVYEAVIVYEEAVLAYNKVASKLERK
ncbi:hypothetical protein LCGC14_1669290 [marine sediment metagenome]|uniref:Uncharacterized protein n=1 Tax=marine sediment metagenome TaxID=412755 RepID=A0A0F9HRS7_9ZZZZ